MKSAMASEAGATEEQFIDRLRRASPSERQSLLLQFLREQFSPPLGLEPSQIGIKDNLLELGVDSLKAVEFKSLLESKLSLELSSSLLFDYPSLDALSEFLLQQACGQEQPILPSSTVQPELDLPEDKLVQLLAGELEQLKSTGTD